MNWAIKIRHPEWLPSALESIESSIKMADKYPSVIKGSMLAIPCHRLLRTIYGGNFRIAWVFLCYGIEDIRNTIYGMLWRFWKYKIRLSSPEIELNKMTGRIEEDLEDE